MYSHCWILLQILAANCKVYQNLFTSGYSHLILLMIYLVILSVSHYYRDYKLYLMDDFLIKLHTGDNNNDYEANPHQLFIRRTYHCVKGDLYEFYLSN